MKKCSYCAEEIQDEAIYCRHCRRDLAVGLVAAGGTTSSAAAPAPATPSGGPKSNVRTLALAGVLVVVGALAWSAASAASDGATGSATRLTSDTAPAPPPPPTIIELGDESALEVKAGSYVSQRFTVDDRRTCRLLGRTVGLAGSRKDVDVIVVDDDAFVNLKNRLAFTPLYQSGQSAAVTLGVTLPGPGVYHIVWSNTFSAFTDKVVQTKGMRVRCE